MNDRVVFVGSSEAIKAERTAEIAGELLGRHVTIPEIWESMADD